MENDILTDIKDFKIILFNSFVIQMWSDTAMKESKLPIQYSEDNTKENENVEAPIRRKSGIQQNGRMSMRNATIGKMSMVELAKRIQEESKRQNHNNRAREMQRR